MCIVSVWVVLRIIEFKFSEVSEVNENLNIQSIRLQRSCCFPKCSHRHNIQIRPKDTQLHIKQSNGTYTVYSAYKLRNISYLSRDTEVVAKRSSILTTFPTKKQSFDISFYYERIKFNYPNVMPNFEWFMGVCFVVNIYNFRMKR